MIVYKETDQWYIELHRMTMSDNEWQQMVRRMTSSDTTSDNEWQQVVQQVTTNDNESQRVTKYDNEWQRITASDKTNEYKWE